MIYERRILMSRFGNKLLALSCVTLILVSGCGSASATSHGGDAAIKAETIIANANDNRTSEEILEEVTAKSATISQLPAYEYPDKDSPYFEIYRYLIDGIGSQYDPADVCIPVVAVIATDDSNDKDIKFYGDFLVYNYNLKGDTLETQSGGNYPGVIHLKKTDKGYEALSFDVCEDGSDFDKSAKELFGDHYDDFMIIYSDDVGIEAMRRQTIADYVLENKLSISQYQDYGWDPVSLEFDENSDEPEDFLQEQSGIKQFKDFDDIISHLEKGQGYAVVNLYGSDVDFLLVTDTVFEADSSAAEASVYTDIGYGPYQVGLVDGNGSAFPLRMEDGIIYGGDNHRYISYFSFENEDMVGLMVKDDVFDEDDNGNFTGVLREDNEINGQGEDFTGGQKEFDKLVKDRDSKPVLEFTKVN